MQPQQMAFTFFGETGQQTFRAEDVDFLTAHCDSPVWMRVTTKTLTWSRWNCPAANRKMRASWTRLEGILVGDPIGMNG